MINKIRKILLLLSISLILLAGYYFYSKQQKHENQVQLRVSDKGMDIVIENFKIVHQNGGRQDWELTAKYAQVNNNTKLTYLKQVNMMLERSAEQKFWITADNGTLKNDSQEFTLEGNVKLIAQADAFVKKFEHVTEPSN